jgi:hypothetical protein
VYEAGDRGERSWLGRYALSGRLTDREIKETFETERERSVPLLLMGMRFPVSRA